ncbi:MAG: hypothetical protein WC247_14960 [Porticoccaceae bacterium]
MFATQSRTVGPAVRFVAQRALCPFVIILKHTSISILRIGVTMFFRAYAVIWATDHRRARGEKRHFALKLNAA